MNQLHKPNSGNFLLIVLFAAVAAIFLVQWFEFATGVPSVVLTLIAAILVTAILDQIHMRKARNRRGSERGVLTYKSLSITPDEAVKDAYLISLATVVAETESEIAGRILADYARAEISFEEAESELEDRAGEIQGRKVAYG